MEKHADIIQTEGSSNCGNACEKIELDSRQKLLLVLPKPEHAESGHIPNAQLIESDAIEPAALMLRDTGASLD